MSAVFAVRLLVPGRVLESKRVPRNHRRPVRGSVRVLNLEGREVVKEEERKA